MKMGTEIWYSNILYKFGKILTIICNFVSILMKYTEKIWAVKTFFRTEKSCYLIFGQIFGIVMCSSRSLFSVRILLLLLCEPENPSYPNKRGVYLLSIFNLNHFLVIQIYHNRAGEFSRVCDSLMVESKLIYIVLTVNEVWNISMKAYSSIDFLTSNCSACSNLGLRLRTKQDTKLAVYHPLPKTF